MSRAMKVAKIIEWKFGRRSDEEQHTYEKSIAEYGRLRDLPVESFREIRLDGKIESEDKLLQQLGVSVKFRRFITHIEFSVA